MDSSRLLSITSGFLEGYERLQAITLALFVENSLSTEPNSLRQLGRQFALLGRLNARLVVREGSPFFWAAFEQLQSALTREPKTVPANLVEQVRLLLLDSFFYQLPDGTDFDVSAAATQAVLPKLGLQFQRDLHIEWVRKVDGSTLILGTPQGPMRVDVREPPNRLRVRSVAIHERSSRLLVSKSPMLFLDTPYPVLDSVNLPRFAASLATALALLADLDPVLNDRVATLIRWYIPVKADSPSAHRSFSSTTLPGVIFLSEAHEPLILAETVVHEYLHNELHVVERLADLFGNTDDRCVFYSPWRDEPRPFRGLFHALYVFAGVLLLLRSASIYAGQESDQVKLFKRRVRLFYQLKLGLAQVPHEGVSQLGRTIIDAIRALLVGSCESQEAAPREIVSHFERWKQEHRDLVKAGYLQEFDADIQ